MNCSFCKKNCSSVRSLVGHERLCKSNPNHQLSWLEKHGRKVFGNQYTKAKQEGRIYILSSETRAKMVLNGSKTKHTEATKEKLSVIAKNRRLGGHTSKQKIWFKKSDGSEVFLQSSFEVRFATLLEEFKIEWCRPEPLDWVDDDGKQHKYYPDFQVGTVYYDTKNSYLAVKDTPKIKAVSEQNGVDIKIVLNENITAEYVKALQA